MKKHLTLNEAIAEKTERLAKNIFQIVTIQETTFKTACDIAFAESILGDTLKARAQKIAAFEVFTYAIEEGSKRLVAVLNETTVSEKGDTLYASYVFMNELQKELRAVLKTLE